MNKTIHYIWLGGKRKPRVLRQCIAGWHRLMPDWQIKEWNESNLDLDEYAFCREAYEAGRYAFAADVLRFSVLYREGGIYLDTDVKLLRSLAPLAETYAAFTGYEYDKVNPGLVLYAREPGDPIIGEMLAVYRQTHFIENGVENQKIVGAYFSEVLAAHGFVYEDRLQQCDSFTILPSTYFCPTDGYGNPINYSENTHSVHLFASSWRPRSDRAKRAIKRLVYRLFGVKLVQRVLHPFGGKDKKQ